MNRDVPESRRLIEGGRLIGGRLIEVGLWDKTFFIFFRRERSNGNWSKVWAEVRGIKRTSLAAEVKRAQSVEHCTGIAEAMGSYPVQAWIFFLGFNFTTT